MEHSNRIITIANGFTLLRMVCTAFMIYALHQASWVTAGICFFVAGISDLFDGMIARFRNECSTLGRILDPIADKLLLLSLFFFCTFYENPIITMPYWFFFVALGRELAQLSGALILFLKNTVFVVQPNLLGKLTTTIEILCMLCLFIFHGTEATQLVELPMLCVITFLLCASGLSYGRQLL